MCTETLFCIQALELQVLARDSGRILTVCSSYEKLKSCVRAHMNSFEVGSPASKETIREAERSLDAKFPESLVQYLQTWGTVAIGPLEYYGIPDDRLGTARVPDGVWFTQQKRAQLGLPDELFILFNNEGDEYHYVDFATGEVRIWNTAERRTIGRKSSDVFEYIYEEAADFL